MLMTITTHCWLNHNTRPRHSLYDFRHHIMEKVFDNILNFWLKISNDISMSTWCTNTFSEGQSCPEYMHLAYMHSDSAAGLMMDTGFIPWFENDLSSSSVWIVLCIIIVVRDIIVLFTSTSLYLTHWTRKSFKSTA